MSSSAVGHRGVGRAGAADRALPSAPACGSKLIVRIPALIIRFLAVVATVAAGFSVLFALAPVLWVTVVVNMAITASLATVGAGIFAVALARPSRPRSRSLGFSMGAIWVIPGLIVLPIVGAISDGVGIRIGMLIMVPVFLIGGVIIAGGRAGARPRTSSRSGRWPPPGPRCSTNGARAGSSCCWCGQLNVYYGNVQVLFDVDLEIDEGEIIALLGTNGAGKSTLLKAICGVVEADKGAVIFDGRDITHAPPNEIAAFGITQVPGGQGVFPGP